VQGGRNRVDGSDLLQVIKGPAKQRADAERALGRKIATFERRKIKEQLFVSTLLALTQAQYPILSFCGVSVLQMPCNVARKPNKMAQSHAPIAIVEHIASTQG